MMKFSVIESQINMFWDTEITPLYQVIVKRFENKPTTIDLTDIKILVVYYKTRVNAILELITSNYATIEDKDVGDACYQRILTQASTHLSQLDLLMSSVFYRSADNLVEMDTVLTPADDYSAYSDASQYVVLPIAPSTSDIKMDDVSSPEELTPTIYQFFSNKDIHGGGLVQEDVKTMGMR